MSNENLTEPREEFEKRVDDAHGEASEMNSEIDAKARAEHAQRETELEGQEKQQEEESREEAAELLEKMKGNAVENVGIDKVEQKDVPKLTQERANEIENNVKERGERISLAEQKLETYSGRISSIKNEIKESRQAIGAEEEFVKAMIADVLHKLVREDELAGADCFKNPGFSEVGDPYWRTQFGGVDEIVKDYSQQHPEYTSSLTKKVDGQDKRLKSLFEMMEKVREEILK